MKTASALVDTRVKFLPHRCGVGDYHYIEYEVGRYSEAQDKLFNSRRSKLESRIAPPARPAKKSFLDILIPPPPPPRIDVAARFEELLEGGDRGAEELVASLEPFTSDESYWRVRESGLPTFEWLQMVAYARKFRTDKSGVARFVEKAKQDLNRHDSRPWDADLSLAEREDILQTGRAIANLHEGGPPTKNTTTGPDSCKWGDTHIGLPR